MRIFTVLAFFGVAFWIAGESVAQPPQGGRRGLERQQKEDGSGRRKRSGKRSQRGQESDAGPNRGPRGPGARNRSDRQNRDFSPRMLMQRFDEADANGDGALDRRELARALRQMNAQQGNRQRRGPRDDQGAKRGRRGGPDGAERGPRRGGPDGAERGPRGGGPDGAERGPRRGGPDEADRGPRRGGPDDAEGRRPRPERQRPDREETEEELDEPSSDFMTQLFGQLQE